ncbi:MAG: inner membrane protein YiaA [Kineosporiaceae bacterium]
MSETAHPAASPSPAPSAPSRPTAAFVGASWAALLLGCGAFLIGLYNATMPLNEKGYYLTLLLFGLFAAVSLQKSVRDRAESVPVSALYLGLAWAAVMSAVTLLAVGLWNAGLTRSEKGFYAMAFALAVFSAIAVQKNVRDIAGSATPAVQAPAAVPAPAAHPAQDPQAWTVSSR